MTQNYLAAKIEIAKPAYSAMTNAQIATAVNALPTVAVYSTLNPAVGRNAIMLSATNDWGWMRGVINGVDASANASGAGAVLVTVATRRLAGTFYDFFLGDASIPISAAEAGLLSAAMTALVSANVLSAATQTKITDLTTTQTPQWQVWGWPAAWIAEDVVVVKAWTP